MKNKIIIKKNLLLTKNNQTILEGDGELGRNFKVHSKYSSGSCEGTTHWLVQDELNHFSIVFSLLQNEVLACLDFLLFLFLFLKNLGKFKEAVWKGWEVISIEVEKLFRPVKRCISTKGVLFSLLMKSLVGFPPVEAV